MKESRSFHPIILKASVLINAPFFLYLLIVSSWQARAVLALVVFMVVAYSLKGLRFKEKTQSSIQLPAASILLARLFLPSLYKVFQQ
jgi:hypothetical protein